MVRLSKRAYMFIDGGYLRAIIRNVLHRDDVLKDVRRYAKVLSNLVNRCRSSELEVMRTYYYDAIIPVEEDRDEHKKQKMFFDELQSIMTSFEVKLGDLILTPRGPPRQKGVDTLMALDMIIKAFLNHYDIAILFAGDRDFVPVVRAVKDYAGRKVYGIYEPNSASPELMRVFDARLPLAGDHLKNMVEGV